MIIKKAKINEQVKFVFNSFNSKLHATLKRIHSVWKIMIEKYSRKVYIKIQHFIPLYKHKQIFCETYAKFIDRFHNHNL